MRKDGENAIQLIRQMKILYREISLVLQTADKYMEEHDWKSKSGNTSVTWSYHIAYPDWWIPQDIFRFYCKEGLEHLLPFISVILFDRDNEAKLSQPLLSAGFFDYEKGNDISIWEYWYAHLHINQDSYEIDGKLRQLILKDSDTYPFKKAYSLAIPLMDIANSQSLVDRIIEPLLDGIGEASIIL